MTLILIQFKFVIRFLASEASQKKILDFGDADKWVLVTLLETDYFFHCAIEQYYFLVKIRARNFFSKKFQAPPPPQNIKWTVPNRFASTNEPLNKKYVSDK